MKEDIFFHDDTILRAEKEKARKLRASQWWKRKCSKGFCHYCGSKVRPAELTMDHIVPLSRGGKSTKGNVVACCKECNNKKKSMLPMEWEQYMEKIAQEDTP
ncbi:MAG: HNH endonuclease [Deltaproteobacteria bacterium]|nr:HNH endonuclease [Deltaproteobacteria bacterium]